jgi:nucleoporin GLE1
MNFLNCLFSQTVGSIQVISIAKSAYPLSAVMSVLWARVPAFGKILLAQFHHKCPYTVPFYPSKDEQNDNQAEYMIACGYSFKSDGKTLEPEDTFLNKMRALVRLYGAILQTPLISHPLGLRLAWKWLASLLSLPPRAKLTPAILHAFLTVTHHKMYETYRKQYVKLIHFIRVEYLPKIEQTYVKEDNRQSLTQLQTYLEDVGSKLARGLTPELPEGFIKNVPESI